MIISNKKFNFVDSWLNFIKTSDMVSAYLQKHIYSFISAEIYQKPYHYEKDNPWKD